VPVRINTVSSSVNVTEEAPLSAEMLEHVVQAVLKRVRQEHEEQRRSKEEREVHDRMSPKDDF
jgi:hypothetical protein